MSKPERAWGSTGHQQEIPGAIDRIPDFDPRTGDHLWSVATMYRVQPATWLDKAVTPHLDMENLLTVQGPFCFYCEQPYSQRLATRRCKGRP
jgi:hypothetical protein